MVGVLETQHRMGLYKNQVRFFKRGRYTQLTVLKHDATTRVLDRAKGFKPKKVSNILYVLKLAARHSQ